MLVWGQPQKHLVPNLNFIVQRCPPQKIADLQSTSSQCTISGPGHHGMTTSINQDVLLYLMYTSLLIGVTCQKYHIYQFTMHINATHWMWISYLWYSTLVRNKV